VKIQGILTPPLVATPISATKLYNTVKGHDTWDFALIDSLPTHIDTNTTNPPPPIQKILDQYKHGFQDPQTLTPPRCYDHAIPLLPGSISLNAKPYHYSPQHKSVIETQVKQLLEAGLITHSHNPFASPVLLVKKKDGT